MSGGNDRKILLWDVAALAGCREHPQRRGGEEEEEEEDGRKSEAASAGRVDQQRCAPCDGSAEEGSVGAGERPSAVRQGMCQVSKGGDLKAMLGGSILQEWPHSRKVWIAKPFP